MMKRRSAEDVRKAINAKVNKLLNYGSLEPRAYVCIICDEFINGNKMERIPLAMLLKNSSTLIPDAYNDIHMDVDSYYKLNETGLTSNISPLEASTVQKMLLSPNASFFSSKDKRTKDGYSCCALCKLSLSKGNMPKFAIANKYYFGTPPSCLTELTDIELALLTPVKTYGYCFSYTGGIQKQLKGSLSYYKVQMSSIARTVAHFDALGLNKNVVVLLYGKMTKEQHKRAMERCRIRTNFVIEALEWLLVNNKEWKEKNINLNEVKQNLINPSVIDNSLEIDSNECDREIEKGEIFNVYFPDGSMSSVSGGQESLEKFNELVQTASLNGYNIAIKADLMKEAVQDFRDNNLVNACLLQFPYGTGGMHEERLNQRKLLTTAIDIEEYVQHLSRISQPHFHHELFILILYNLLMKQQMVKTAGWRVRNKCDAHALAHELTIEAVSDAIRNREQVGQKRKYMDDGSRLLNAVDAVAKAIPHTNEAAKQARGCGECLQHHFGPPSIFLTVTPDDDNCFGIQVMSNSIVDNDKLSRDLTDSELAQKAMQRTKLRLKFPGICALYFEYALEIIIEEVIGWDLKRKQPRKDMCGLFGKAIAYTVTIEEQGRRTLHSHMQIWIEDFNKQREALHSKNRATRRKSKKEIIKFVDDVSSCCVFFKNKTLTNHKKRVTRAFEHPCNIGKKKRCFPVVATDQELRNLRQKNASSFPVATCPHCEKTWTGDELMESYLVCQQIIPGLTKYPDGECRRLKSMAVEYQKELNVEDHINENIIAAGYNHHTHTKSCFERYTNGGDSKAKFASKEKVAECRYRYPQRSQKETVIENATEETVPWFMWDGSRANRHIKEIRLKRGSYDVFQNICCPAISYSNLTCNTNIAAVLPGPVAFYCFKYNLKGTQEEDSREYGFVKDAMQKVLSRLRNIDSDISEALKRVLAASFAHQKTNVIGSPLAGFLIRNEKRFWFSHFMVWCPLRDLEQLLEGRDATTSIIRNGNIPFFQCSALHYLCRPDELENISAFEFYSKYEVIRVTSKSKKDLLCFINNECFQHPSYNTTRGSFLQGVRQREVAHLIRIFQYDLPDTAEFNGSIMANEGMGNEPMEKYCKLAMILFLPFRTLDDLECEGSFTETFKSAVNANLISAEAISFLQNLQDTRSNCCRVTGLEDDLQRVTELQRCMYNEQEEAFFEDMEATSEVFNTDDFLNILDMEDDKTVDGTLKDDDDILDALPLQYNLAPIRKKGSMSCGYSCIARMNTTVSNNIDPILENEVPSPSDMLESPCIEIDNEEFGSTIPTQHDVVSVLVTRTRRKRQSFEEITGRKKIVKVLQANGTVKSIIDWARKAKLDAWQRRAFEIFVSTYVLTFYIDQPDEIRVAQDRRPYLLEKKRLRKLTEAQRRGSDQLICFLHGPGGSGKTTIIDMVVKYAQEYSSFLPGFDFNRRTIMVTAMTGVAATILMGDTTHSALYLNQKRPLEAEQIELWYGTRLVIIDEISFASKQDFVEFHKKLRRLKQQIHLKYGGLSIIFAGDMRQLEPVGAFKKPIYTENCAEFRDWVNCYIELQGMHRFKNDKEWGEILLRFRNGEVTKDDIRKINERVVKKDDVLPENIRYATYFNRDRDSINTALFEERCRTMYQEYGSCDDTVLIFSNNVQVQDSTKKYIPFRQVRSFWEHCGEDSIKLSHGQGRMDPVLKLYSGCRVMLPCNTDVEAGEANGTQAAVEKIVLKHDESSEDVFLIDGIKVSAVKASQVSYLLLRHCNPRIQPALFTVSPKQHTFQGNILKPACLQIKGDDREALKMKAFQVPVVVNNATTGHKLQGSGVECLFVHNWSYVTNWVYVMLSRVKTLNGLYCRKPIDEDVTKYAVPEELKKMIRGFSSKAPTYWSKQQYKTLFPPCDSYSSRQ